MTRRLGAALLVAALAAVAGAASPAIPPYHLVKTVPLGPPDKWDFVRFDSAQDRVYVAHRSEVTVIDGRTGAIVGRVSGIAGSHDVATVPALGRGYADNSDTGDVTVFDLKSLKAVDKIPADNDSDAMLYDPATRLLIVANGDAHDASIIDPTAGKRLANVPLGGSPEMIAADGRGKAFVNVASSNSIARIDLRTRRVDARWPTPGCESPHGLAIDRATSRLFATCRGKMIVLDEISGKPLALLPIGAGSDGAAFDPMRKLAFSSNKDGTLSIVAERGGRFVSVANVNTAAGAKNMALDPRSGRVFLVTATVTGQRPPKRSGDAPEYDFAPGSVKLLMLDPPRG